MSTGLIERKIHGVVIEPKVNIRPKVEVNVATASQKNSVLDSAKKVMATHSTALKALRDR